MLRIRLTLLALAAIVPIAGCGGGSTSSSTQATSATPTTATSAAQTAPTNGSGTLTRAALITNADAICQRVGAKRDLLKFRNEAGFDLVVPQLAAYQHELFTQLSKLVPPTALAGDWNQLLDDTHVLADSTASLSQVVQSHNHANGKSLLAAFAQARLRMRSIAKSDGFTNCSQY